MPRRISLLTGLLACVVLLSGCAISVNKGPNVGSAGMMRSVDKAETWQKKNQVPSVSGVPGSIEPLGILDIEQDPQDPKALYLLASQGGFWYTYDRSNTWQKSDAFPSGKVTALDVDPGDKCTIYASSGNRIFRTTDCSRSWSTIYADTRPAASVSVLEVDPSASGRIYAGLSTGDLLISSDSGENWRTKRRFNKPMKQLLIDPRNADIMYAVLKDQLWKSENKGAAWAQIKDSLAALGGTAGLRRAYLDLNKEETVFIVTKDGLLRSRNGGTKWVRVKLITPPGGVVVRDFAISPDNSQEMYYAVGNKVQKSMNAGKSWETKELKTPSVITRLIVDQQNDSTVYAALYYVEE